MVAAEPASMDVSMQRTYHSIDDLDSDVPEGERVKGFKYGKTLVPISATDEASTKYESERELVTIGFTKASSVPRMMR
jgi:ATP-dependent DNA helicase 2 subunit 2